MKRNFVSKEIREGDIFTERILLCTVDRREQHYFPCVCRVDIEVVEILLMESRKSLLKIKPIELKFWTYGEPENEEVSIIVDRVETNIYDWRSQDDLHLISSEDSFRISCEVYLNNFTNQGIMQQIHAEIEANATKSDFSDERERMKKKIEKEIDVLGEQISQKRIRLVEIKEEESNTKDRSIQLQRGIKPWAKYLFESKN